MNVYVLMNVFNEIDNLPRSWEASVTHLSPRGEVQLVAVDGKYPDYPGKEDFSTDGTREWCLEHGVLISVVDYECEKRTAGLRYIDLVAKDGDFIYVSDADEDLTSIFSWPGRVGKIDYTRESRPITYGRCRLIRWEPGLHFKHRHYDLYDAWDSLVASLEDAPEYQMVGTGIHHDQSHEAGRRKDKRSYYSRLREREGHPAEVPVIAV